MPPRVSAIIVAWNGQDYVRGCIKSLRGQGGVEIIVSDNGSTDGTPEMVRSEFPEVVLQENGRNLGYAGGVNRGARRARGEYILILNSDIEVHDVDVLVRRLEADPGVGIVGPRLLNEDGSHQPSARKFPTPYDALRRFTILGLVTPRPPKHEEVVPGSECDVEQVSGAAMLLRRDLFDQLRGMDEDFFFFWEDVDFCKRIWKLGKRARYVGSVTFTHHRGKSRKKARSELSMVYLRGLFTYFTKHYGRRFVAWYRWVFKPLFVLNQFYGIARDSIGLVTRRRGRPDRIVNRFRLLTVDLIEFLRTV